MFLFWTALPRCRPAGRSADLAIVPRISFNLKAAVESADFADSRGLFFMSAIICGETICGIQVYPECRSRKRTPAHTIGSTCLRRVVFGVAPKTSLTEDSRRQMNEWRVESPGGTPELARGTRALPIPTSEFGLIAIRPCGPVPWLFNHGLQVDPQSRSRIRRSRRRHRF